MHSYNHSTLITEPDNYLRESFQVQDEKFGFDQLAIQFLSKAYGKSLV